MNFLQLALNAVIVLSAAVFLAYVGLYYFDFGLFTTLPDAITGFFLDFAFLQYVALGGFVAALIAKAAVRRRADSASEERPAR